MTKEILEKTMEPSFFFFFFDLRRQVSSKQPRVYWNLGSSKGHNEKRVTDLRVNMI
jgi:hypothetical protein